MRIVDVNAATQKVVNQLSALSASRKQPKLLSLCKEDYVKHKTITNAWNVYQRRLVQKRRQQLEEQHQSIQKAMSELKEISPQLYNWANEKKPSKFPLDMRMPTDFPPNKPWVYNVKK